MLCVAGKANCSPSNINQHQESLDCFATSSPFFFLFPLVTFIIISSIIYPLIAGVIGAPQMTSQPISSIFPCSPLSSGTWRTPGLSIPWCCLPASSSVRLVFFLLSLFLARWFWPDLINRRHVHTTIVRSSCGLIACCTLAKTSSFVTWSFVWGA